MGDGIHGVPAMITLGEWGDWMAADKDQKVFCRRGTVGLARAVGDCLGALAVVGHPAPFAVCV